jgi:hypothetical protein
MAPAGNTAGIAGGVSAAAPPQAKTTRHSAKNLDRQRCRAKMMRDIQETSKTSRGTTLPGGIRDIKRDLGCKSILGRRSTT